MFLHRRVVIGALVIQLSAATLAWPRAAGAATIYRPPANVSHAASCSPTMGNASNRINRWLVGLRTHPGDTVQFAAHQCYRTDKTILFSAKRSLTFDGNGATFRSFGDNRMERTNSHFKIEGDTSVIVKNLNIVGSAPGGYVAAFEAQHGFDIVGGTGVTIRNVSVNRVYGDFVSLRNGTRGATPTNITIENSKFGAATKGNDGAGRQELTIDDGYNVNVTHNYFGHGSRSAIDIEPTTRNATIRNITIQSNTWGPNTYYWFANVGAMAPIRGVHLLNNTLLRTMIVEIDGRRSTINRSDYQLIGNVSKVPQAVGNCEHGGGQTMRIVGVTSLVIRSNTQRMKANNCQYLVDGRNVTRASITSNHLQNAWKVGEFDSASQVCEGNNYSGPNNPPSRRARLDSRATVCPGYRVG